MSITRPAPVAALDFHEAKFDDEKAPETLTIRRGSIGMDGMTRFEEFNFHMDELDDKHATLFMPHGAKYAFEYSKYKDRPDMQQFQEGPERFSQAALSYLEDEIGSINDPEKVEIMEGRARLIKSGGSRAGILSERGGWFNKTDSVMLISTNKGLFGLDKNGAIGRIPEKTEQLVEGKKMQIDTVTVMRAQKPTMDYTFRDGDTFHSAIEKTMDAQTIARNQGEVGRAVEAEHSDRDRGSVSVSFGR
ncbi:MAG: hypothetical protein GC134_02970 [Proteobacteria bacterium]|nr:hypothetical protein [Pseudomonadota bacterium]